MFSKVIIGVDHDHGPHGVGVMAAIARALAPGASVLLVDVIPYSEPAGSGLRAAFEHSAREEAMAALTRARDQIALPEAELRVVLDQSAAKGLKTLAGDEGADLIIVGAAHRGPLGRVVLGDVTHGVLNGAPCPVLVAPRDHPRGSVSVARIGVAFDWSPEAAHALDLAVGIAKERGSRLEVIQSLDVGAIPAVWGFQIADYLDGVLEPAQERMDELIRGLGVPARGDVIEGASQVVLAEAAARLDLMICGSRGWGPAGRLAFGSTAEHLMHEARCAVLVLPRGAEQANHAPPVTARAGTDITAEQAGQYAGSPSRPVGRGTRT